MGINQLLTDLNHLVQVHPSLHTNQFHLRSLTDDIAVRMNGTDVIQVLLNLVVNGFQCSPHAHSVHIDANVLKEPLDLATFRDGPEERLLNVENFENSAPLLMVTVTDTGPGIPPETLPKIFQLYFTTKGARNGTGLGLNIVQRLVKEAKGALHLRTRLGEGTTFTVYLPAVPLPKF